MNRINGEVLKTARKKKNYTQDELASKIGVSKVTICWYENGERTPNYDNLIKLCDVLDLSLNELAGRDVNVISDKGEPYGIHLAKQDICIINEIKKKPKLYKQLYRDPVRTVELISRKLK